MRVCSCGRVRVKLNITVAVVAAIERVEVACSTVCPDLITCSGSLEGRGELAAAS